jgi:hypothetical protein
MQRFSCCDCVDFALASCLRGWIPLYSASVIVNDPSLVVFPQVRGPKKHLKRLNAPKHWMLDKMGGIYAPKASCGPHKGRESLPLVIILRNRLKYALTKREVTQICMQKLVKVDGKTRTDSRFPTGFMGT